MSLSIPLQLVECLKDVTKFSETFKPLSMCAMRTGLLTDHAVFASQHIYHIYV